MDGSPSLCQYHITYLIICNNFMALYAVDEEDLLYAGDADPKKTYWCLDCFGPVKRRRGKHHFYHFYHLRSAPTCRLYSKSEDHLLAQLQLQKSFPEGIIEIERPFLKINRVADACWEAEKVVFEIQCSPLTEKEGEMRIKDYRSVGYEVVWLLDDKRYNRRKARPAEEFLRKHSTYYLSIQKGLYSKHYDQFEIFSEKRRVKKGKPLFLDLKKIKAAPIQIFDPKIFPDQIVQLNCRKHFAGDRLDQALKNRAGYMPYWRSLEKELIRVVKPPSKLKRWLLKHWKNPYKIFLHFLIRRTAV